MEVVWLVTSFAVILAGALLFTNAIEWAGYRLGLGEGATGSILAAVGTAMPETLIPIIAVIGGAEGSEGVAVGAIIGAPFLLATIAMALVGIAALMYKSRRPQGTRLKADVKVLDRDLIFFLIFFAAAIAFGAGLPFAARLALAIVFVVAYVVYVSRTLSQSGGVEEPEAIGRLIMDRTGGDEPANGTIVLQILVGLGAIVGGAHLFVEELIAVAEDLGIEPLVLSLVLAPLATELPEKANSFLWVRDGKDSLALGKHHRRDGLPVAHPRRLRPRVHGLGPRHLGHPLGSPRHRRRCHRLLGAPPARPLRAAGDRDLALPVLLLRRLRRRRVSGGP